MMREPIGGRRGVGGEESPELLDLDQLARAAVLGIIRCGHHPGRSVCHDSRRWCGSGALARAHLGQGDPFLTSCWRLGCDVPSTVVGNTALPRRSRFMSSGQHVSKAGLGTVLRVQHLVGELLMYPSCSIKTCCLTSIRNVLRGRCNAGFGCGWRFGWITRVGKFTSTHRVGMVDIIWSHSAQSLV